MENFLDRDEKIRCPYDNAHYIRRCKMQYHIVKCKKNFPNTPLVACSFNQIHMIPQPELQYHHQICPDRKKVEALITPDSSVDQNKYPIHKSETSFGENWDDVNVSSYDPKPYLENNKIIRHLDVASAAQRRTFRAEERLRHQQLEPPKPSEPLPPVYTSTSRRPNEPINLPPRPRVADISDDRSNLRDRIKSGSRKEYLQYDPYKRH